MQLGKYKYVFTYCVEKVGTHVTRKNDYVVRRVERKVSGF